MLKRIAGNTALLMGTYVVRIGISLAITPFLISHLGREAYGIWILGSSFWIGGLLSTLDLGIKAAVIKLVAEHDGRNEQEQTADLIQAAVGAYVILGVIACSLVHLLRMYWFESLFSVPAAEVATAKTLLGIFAWQLLFEFPGMAFEGTLEGYRRFELVRILELSQAVGFGAAVVLVMSYRPGVIPLGIAFLLISVGRVATSFVLARRACPTWRVRRAIRWQPFQQIFAFSAKILGMRLNALVYNNMDRMIIGIALTTTLLTDYDIVYRLYALVLVSMTFVSQLLVSVASWLEARGDHVGLTRMKLWATKTTVAICVPIAVTTMVLAAPILHFWIGPAFARDATNARLFISYLVLWALLPAAFNVMVGTGRIAPLLRIQIPTTALNLALSILLAPLLGIRGVIIGTVTGELVSFAFYLPLFFGRTWSDLRPLLARVIVRTYPWIVFSGIVVALVNRVRPPESLMQTAVYWLTGILLFWMPYLVVGTDTEEWEALNAISANRLNRVPIVRNFMLWKLRAEP